MAGTMYYAGRYAATAYRATTIDDLLSFFGCWPVLDSRFKPGTHPNFAVLAGDKRKTGGPGMTRLEYVIPTAHAALRVEHGANAPGFRRGVSVKDECSMIPARPTARPT
jgi:hypothetical protein